MKFETDCGPVDALLSCWGGEATAHHGLLLATSSSGGDVPSVGPLGSVGGVGGTAVGQASEEGLQQHHLHYSFAEDSGQVEVKSEPDCTSAKATMDVLDSLLMTTSSSSPPTSSSPGGGQFAELKPLPPFHTYTASLNGIYAPQPPRHHDQAPSPHSTLDPRCGGDGEGAGAEDAYKGTEVYYSEPVVVSSSGDHLKGVSVVEADQGVEYLLPPDIEDIAAIIGSAIADTTVPGGGGQTAAQVAANGGGGGSGGSDGWMDLDAWIDTACVVTSGDPGGGKAPTDALNELASQFAAAAAAAAANQQHQQQQQSMAPTSTLQSLLTQGVPQHQQHLQHHIGYQQQMQMQQQQQSTHQQQHQMSVHKQQREQYSQPHHHMPLLQSRLQNGAPVVVKMEAFQVEYDAPPPPMYMMGNDMVPHTTHGGSPPGLVQSTTAESPTAPSSSSSASPGRFPTSPRKYGRGNSLKAAAGSTTADFGPSLSDPSGNPVEHQAGSFPPPGKSKSKSRSKSGKAGRGGSGGGGGGQAGGGLPEADGGLGAYPDGGLGGGKEKPVHRCGICNRGFLNKSNIKVHLRTHTGEKPFRCDTCGKAFRQKAHLIKHQQIHKRVGRD